MMAPLRAAVFALVWLAAGVAVAKLMLVLLAGFEMALSPFCAAALAAINRVATPSKQAIFISSLKAGFSQAAINGRTGDVAGHAVVGKVRLL